MKRIFSKPSTVGVIFGTVLFAVSLTPSLIPRSWIQQAIISALSFMCGYGIGVGLNALWHHLELPTIPAKYQKRISQLFLAAFGILLLYFLYRTLTWQNNVRQMVEQEPISSAYPLRTLLLTLAFPFLFFNSLPFPSSYTCQMLPTLSFIPFLLFFLLPHLHSFSLFC